MTYFFIDRKYRLPRIWSNKELARFAHHFSGDVVNISGWRDEDKEGRYYKDYFKDAQTYTITNFKSEARGYQGYVNEIYLDLEKELSPELINRFDVVFNHTTLEHIYDVNAAFKNLCLMSRDIVILVVPFLQQMHAAYGDYWRFTPLTVKSMFEENYMFLLYLSFNSHKNSSVYIFSIASKKPKNWENIISNKFSYIDREKPFDGLEPYIGCHAIYNSRYALRYHFGKLIDKISNKLSNR